MKVYRPLGTGMLYVSSFIVTASPFLTSFTQTTGLVDTVETVGNGEVLVSFKTRGGAEQVCFSNQIIRFLLMRVLFRGLQKEAMYQQSAKLKYRGTQINLPHRLVRPLLQLQQRNRTLLVTLSTQYIRKTMVKKRRWLLVVGEMITKTGWGCFEPILGKLLFICSVLFRFILSGLQYKATIMLEWIKLKHVLCEKDAIY